VLKSVLLRVGTGLLEGTIKHGLHVLACNMIRLCKYQLQQGLGLTGRVLHDQPHSSGTTKAGSRGHAEGGNRGNGEGKDDSKHLELGVIVVRNIFFVLCLLSSYVSFFHLF
jgi:hypothetical protein